jgi:hypothetical protein
MLKWLLPSVNKIGVLMPLKASNDGGSIIVILIMLNSMDN